MQKKLIAYTVLLLFTINGFAQKAKLVIPKGHDRAITAVAISKNKKFLATASAPFIIIWDIFKEKELYRIKANEIATNDKIDRLLFADDDKKIIVNSLYVYDIITEKRDYNFILDNIHITSPDNKYYLKTDENYSVKTFDVYNVNTDQKLNTIQVQRDKQYNDLVWHNDEMIFYGSGGWLVFNISNGKKKEVSLKTNSYDLYSISFEAGRVACTERLRDVIDIYDYYTGKLVKTKKTTGIIYNLFFKNETLISFESDLSLQKQETFFVNQYDKDGNNLKKTKSPLEGESIFFADKVFDFSKKAIAYNDFNKIKLYDIDEKEPRQAFSDRISDYHSFKYPDLINQQHFNDSIFNVGVYGSGNQTGGNIVFDKDNYRPKLYYDISGTIIYTNDGRLAAGIDDKKIVLANNKDGSIVKTIKFPATVEFINSTSTFFNKEGSKIYIANYTSNSIAEVDVAKGTLAKPIVFDEEFSVATSNSFDGEYLAAVVYNKKNEVFRIVYDIEKRKLLSKEKIQSGNWKIFFIGQTSFYLLHDAETKNFVLLNAADNKYYKEIEKGEFAAYLGYNDAKGLMAFANRGYSGSAIELNDLNGVLQKSICVKDVTNYKVTFNGNGAIMYAPQDDKGIQVWDIEKGELLGTYYFVQKSSEFVFVSPEGLFDGSPQAAKELYLVKNFKPYSLDKFFEKFYTPNLLLRKKNGEKFSPPDIDNLLKDIKVKIFYAEQKRNIESEDGKPSYASTSGIAEITVSATAPEDKVDEIRLFHNGKAVNLATRGLFVTDADGTDTKKYTINLLPGQNNFRAIALNSQRTESEPDEIVVAYNKSGGNTPTPKPVDNNTVVVDAIDKNATLHIVVVGINAYKGKINPLTYALPDATAFKTELEKDAKSVIGNVKSYLIADDAASKAGIVAAFENIKKTAKPEDVFVFYYAGHGYIHPSNKEFYLVSSDVADGGESLLKNGVSAKELQTFAVDIPAQKQVFIMDACQSAGAFEQMLKHDGEQQKNLAVLARSTGTHWMAASGSTETAKEFGELGHGVFTYSLLEALKGKAVNNKMITVNGLKNYLQIIVPELVKKYGGNSQYPASYGFGNDFPVEIVK